MKPMKRISEVYDALKTGAKKTIAVGAAGDEDVLTAVNGAYKAGFADAILVGDKAKIESEAKKGGIDLSPFEIVHVEDDVAAAREAVRLTSTDKADIAMKGLVQSGDFLRQVLDREIGLRKEGSVISSVGVMELLEYDRLVILTDAGFTPAPDLEGKVALIKNAIEVAHAVGIEVPKVAPLCGAEAYNPKIPATVDAKALHDMNVAGELTGCVVSGPISLDLALDKEAAHHKGFDDPVAGDADILLCPDIEAGNILYKAMVYLAHVQRAGIMTGAAKPIVFTSRADSPETKMNTIAFSVLMSS